jgi:uncharacterized DUF497 family protein
MRFEWDRGKSKSNLSKHDVPFEEAATVFGDPLSLTISDPGHSEEEDRFVTIGVSSKLRTIVLVHTDRGDHVRIVSARQATTRERKDYEEGI